MTEKVAYSGGKMTHVVTLGCHHVLYFSTPSPVKGETIYCTTCRSEQIVLLAAHEWHVRCLDCRFARHTGRARLSAEGHVTKHGRKHGHRVELYDGEHHEYTFTPDKDQMMLDMGTNDPPY